MQSFSYTVDFVLFTNLIHFLFVVLPFLRFSILSSLLPQSLDEANVFGLGPNLMEKKRLLCSGIDC